MKFNQFLSIVLLSFSLAYAPKALSMTIAEHLYASLQTFSYTIAGKLGITAHLAEPGKTIAETAINMSAQESQTSPSLSHVKNNRALFIRGVSEFQKSFSTKTIQENLPDFVKVTPPQVTPELPAHIKNFMAQFVEKEKELFKNGYYPFVHGQPRESYLLQKLYTKLWSLKKKQPANNFIFAHIQPILETPEEFHSEEIIRQRLLTKGQNVPFKLSDFDNMLFINHALFANFLRPGCCSALYALLNMKKRSYDIKSVFTALNYDWVYSKHKNEIDVLAKDYQNACSAGSLLIVAIPKAKVNNFVFLTDNFGRHTQVMVKGEGLTKDTQKILETIYNNPEKITLPGLTQYGLGENTDLIEFCLVMTQKNGGLDPSTGIQVHPLLSGDPEKLKELQQREDALLAKITADIQAHEKQQQLTRAAVIASHVVQSAEAKPAVPQQAMGRMHNIINHLAN